MVNNDYSSGMMLRNKTHGAPKKPEMDIRFVRARLVERGDSLHAWAGRNGFNAVHVTRSIRGDYHGPKARRVISLLSTELGQ